MQDEPLSVCEEVSHREVEELVERVVEFGGVCADPGAVGGDPGAGAQPVEVHDEFGASMPDTHSFVDVIWATIGTRRAPAEIANSDLGLLSSGREPPQEPFDGLGSRLVYGAKSDGDIPKIDSPEARSHDP